MLSISEDAPQSIILRGRAIEVMETLIALMEELERIFVGSSEIQSRQGQTAIGKQRSNLDVILRSRAEKVAIPTLWMLMAEAKESRKFHPSEVPSYDDSVQG